MKKATLMRKYLNDRTLGKLFVFNEKNEQVGKFYTLELPDLGNQHNISCIPEGIYNVAPNHTAAHPDTYRVLDVPNRSGILMHIANYPKDIRGCIAVGMQHMDLDGDGKLDVAHSTEATESLWNLIGESTFRLTIIHEAI